MIIWYVNLGIYCLTVICNIIMIVNFSKHVLITIQQYFINQIIMNPVSHRILVLLVFVALFQHACSGSLKVDLNTSTIEDNRIWTRIKIDVKGGASPLTYYYDEYPEGWNPVFSYLYAPKNKIPQNQKLFFRVRVIDNKENFWAGTVILLSKNNQLKLSLQSHPYDYQFAKGFFEESVPKTVLNKLTMKQFQTVYKARNINPQQRVSEFEKLPIIQDITSLSNTPGSSTHNIENIIEEIQSKNQNGKFSLTELLQKLRSQSPQQQPNYVTPQSFINNLRRNQLGYSGYIENGFNYGSFGNTGDDKKPDGGITIFPTLKIPIIIEQPKQIKPDPKKNSSTTTIPTVPTIPNNYNPNPNSNSQANKNNTNTASSSINYSIDDIFLKLPTQKQLDNIILTADSFGILKTIQAVIRSSLNCTNKVYYLQDFLGRLQSAIQMKVFASSQLSIIIQVAEQQIQRLVIQIQSSNQQLSSLKIKELKSDLNKKLSQLEQAYNKFNQVEFQIKPENAKIAGYQLDIKNLREKATANRNVLQQKKIRLVQVDSSIKNLQRQLQDMNNNKIFLNNEIKTIESLISQAEKTIDKDFSIIKQIQNKIDLLQEKSDFFKLESKKFEIAVERLQSDVLEKQQKEDKIKIRLESLEQRLTIQKLKLVYDELKKLGTMVEALKKVQPTIQQQIDTFNYQCLKIEQEQKKSSQSTVLVYIVGQKDYTNYLREVYGAQVIDKSLQGKKLTSSLELTSLNILNPLWKSTFGSPFSTYEMANRNQFSFSGDFNCLEPSSLVSGYGVIRLIKQKTITIDVDEGGRKIEKQLNLGACTRIDSTTTIPRIGQNIYWKGNVQKQFINTYHATCI